MIIRPEIVTEIARAVSVPGPVPARHYETILRHRAEWPTLWAALDKLLIDYYTEEPF